MMPSFAQVVLYAIMVYAMALIAPHGAQALPIGVKSPVPSPVVILVKRECIAWERGRCVRWANCGTTVC
jgi:hypothetical protein